MKRVAWVCLAIGAGLIAFGSLAPPAYSVSVWHGCGLIAIALFWFWVLQDP